MLTIVATSRHVTEFYVAEMQRWSRAGGFTSQIGTPTVSSAFSCENG